MIRNVERYLRTSAVLLAAATMLATGFARAEPGAHDPDTGEQPGSAGAAAGSPEAAAGDEAHAAAEPPASSPPEEAVAPEAGGSAKRYSPLDRRVMLLARELDLDARQQAQVRKVLQDQRDQVLRVWNDAAIPAARRVSATQAIGDLTATRIRALLTEDQRRRYSKPRRRDVAVGATGTDAEKWMDTAKPKTR